MTTTIPTKRQRICNKTNICSKIYNLARRTRVNGDKLLVYLRYEYPLSTHKTMSAFINAIEHDIITNNNNLRKMLQ